MRSPGSRALVVVGLVLALLGGCDRKVEPFVPGEQPSQPDLRKIFPPGAAQAEKSAGPMGQPASDRGGPPPAPGEDAESAAPVAGRVTIKPDLAARAPADAVLFVIARRGASGPPLAVKRIESPKFPVTFEIGPDDRMIKAMPFVGPILLSARLDSDGSATTRTAGDLQGASAAPVEPGAEGVEIELGEVL
jgi:hypothetical protein